MENIVVTIARQIGSGGYDLARSIAERFNFKLIDRELVTRAAEILKTDTAYLEKKEEKVTSLIESILGVFSIGTPEVGSLSNNTYPDYTEIFEAQTTVLKSFAQQHNIVALGRGSFFIFKDHPKHLSVFLKANLDYRVKNVSKEFNISQSKAIDLVKETEEERIKYIKKLTGLNRYDLRNYDIVIDLSCADFELAKNFILDVINFKFFQNDMSK
ncbi:Cytidylate kinase [Desulfurella amilsii]|uniref:Cytidylate kinase n=1 Tax=Desulfurella amilsii TaxID=1562698 RepID=A0A1X4XW40_9BACT|nr:cytidylate kinase-like family protein [Desulfurella amilsii]OSS41750.1 Cytidylate kinase [Desulfurella amilsii]